MASNVVSFVNILEKKNTEYDQEFFAKWFPTNILTSNRADGPWPLFTKR